ncbi:ABC transporter permease [Rhodococcus sp. HNM0563]|uniref:ABC transporter permease n=1 Tax=Rhodococcus sp. HNM0563 TaxID=2716339 RepID=UPI00146AC8CC|nr:ABC transporter permease [Rhodococcus sp. HNM0563]NLU63317.1 ABC transporter permease [Rhodococcus sp. HNM0563]
MSYASALHSEWIKTRSLPSLGGALALLFLVTVGFSLVGSATLGREEAGEPDFDPLLISFFGVNFGQVVAITFGALAAAAQFKNHGTRVWLVAVPRRGVFYLAGLSVVASLTFVVGLATALACFVGGQFLLGEHRLEWTDAAAGRAILGCAVYLTAMALFASGMATLLRSAAATLGVLVPLVLLLSFVLGDVAGSSGVADYLPDRAGRQVLVLDPLGSPGPWAGLVVTGVWSGAAVLAGWWAFRRRDC